MNGQSLLTLIGSFGFPTIAVAVIAFFGVRSQLRSNQPKNDAEADLAVANARARDMEAQGGIVSRLSAENTRLDAANIVLSNRLDVLEAKFDAADEQNQTLKRQNRLLTESLSRASSWMQRYYDAGHPVGMEPPPVLMTFKEDET